MAQTRPFTFIAAILFALMAAAHLYRLAVGFDISVGALAVPLWISWIALVVTASLSALLFREARS
jgi:hypothetical protein